MPASSVAPALERLRFLEGPWQMELSQAAFLPEGEVVGGAAAFEFIDDGRLLAFRQEDAATWIIGGDDSSAQYTALYSDGRGVSRVYAMTLDGQTWKIWRDDDAFSQRFERSCRPTSISSAVAGKSGAAVRTGNTTSPSPTAAAADHER